MGLIERPHLAPEAEVVDGIAAGVGMFDARPGVDPGLEEARHGRNPGGEHPGPCRVIDDTVARAEDVQPQNAAVGRYREGQPQRQCRCPHDRVILSKVLHGFNRSHATGALRLSPRIVLALIIAIGLVVRIAYLRLVVHTPGFVWADPDGYLDHALMLARGPGGWHWTFDAVRYQINGQVHALPPLYP